MGNLIDTEIRLELNGTYSAYRELVRSAAAKGLPTQFDQVRYAMAMADYAKQIGQSKQVMFLGGMAVLGNLVNHLGDNAIGNWRGTHDLDLALKGQESMHLVLSVFDNLDIYARSLSIPDKMTVRGYSVDAEGNPLTSTTIDVYVPNGRPGNQINFNGLKLGKNAWESLVEASFFGIPLYSVNPETLLSMKLDVDLVGGRIRKKDLEDIIHLSAIMEKRGVSPSQLKTLITESRFAKLKEILSGFYVANNPLMREILVKNSDKYRKAMK